MMLFDMLSGDDRKYLLPVACLLAVADKPLHDGKFQKNRIQSLMLQNFNADREKDKKITLSSREMENLAQIFQENIEKSDSMLNQSAIRMNIVRTILNKNLIDVWLSISTCKLMLFELMLLAWADDAFSDMEQYFLRQFQRHHGLDDEIFNELLACAEAEYREVKKTLNLVLE